MEWRTRLRPRSFRRIPRGAPSTEAKSEGGGHMTVSTLDRPALVAELRALAIQFRVSVSCIDDEGHFAEVGSDLARQTADIAWTIREAGLVDVDVLEREYPPEKPFADFVDCMADLLEAAP